MYEQMNFWEMTREKPLADKVRPRNLDEFIGQDHLLQKGKPLRRMLEDDQLASMILWGPPGVGKTTLAQIIANITSADYHELSAVTSGVKDLKVIIEIANTNNHQGKRTIVFVDEIHRFNKLQQDAFLPVVEKGTIILIGATTENPSFEVNNALLSRVAVFRMNPLGQEDIKKIIAYALTSHRGYGNSNILCDPDIIDLITVSSDGDARTALNYLELLVKCARVNELGQLKIDYQLVEDVLPQKAFLYSKKGDEHYDYISALHKSMRCSDPDAAAYWLERMLQAGEDPTYVARRLVRFASEDIGMADTNALTVAVNAFDAAKYVGMPECDVNLMQAVVYLSIAPKSNALYNCCENAKKLVSQTQTLPVPLQLRNPTTKLNKSFGYGIGYKYAHEYQEGITNMQCLPEELSHINLYTPSENGMERKIKDRMEYIKKRKAEM